MDLVSYNKKNNWANGEYNHDGSNQNYSWNCGIEGPTDDAQIKALRLTQMKNFLAILMLSNGVPMLLSGDEVGKSQGGNNNVYCQDNEISWFDWSLVETNKDLLRFAKMMIAFRKRCRSLRRGEFLRGRTNERGIGDVEWHGCQLNAPGFNDPYANVLSFTMGALDAADPDIHAMMNMHHAELPFQIRPLPDKRRWHLFVQTSALSPADIFEQGTELLLADQQSMVVPPRSIIVLISR